MRRLVALSIAFLSLVVAGSLWTRDRPVAEAQPSPAPLPEADVAVLPAPPKAALTDEQREARRFNRYDRDKDRKVDRTEYLASRRKAFAKLDTNKDGQLDFEEYAITTARKFAKADGNGDMTLSAAEFATTATKRRPKPACDCGD